MTITDIIQNIEDLTNRIKGKKPKEESIKEETQKKEIKESKEKVIQAQPTPSEVSEPVSDSTTEEVAEPQPIEESDEEDHLVRPSAFFGS